jgi:hypothetical protein
MFLDVAIRKDYKEKSVPKLGIPVSGIPHSGI